MMKKRSKVLKKTYSLHEISLRFYGESSFCLEFWCYFRGADEPLMPAEAPVQQRGLRGD